MAYNIPEVVRKILTESPFTAYEVYVDSKVPDYTGSGDTPDGTKGKPYRSIQDALNILNALPITADPATWLALIHVAPGTYNEDLTVARYGVVEIICEGSVIIGKSLLDPTFNPLTDIRDVHYVLDQWTNPSPFFIAYLVMVAGTGEGFGGDGSGGLLGGLEIVGNLVLDGDNGIGSPEGCGVQLGTATVWGNPLPGKQTALGNYGIVGNDGTLGLSPYPVQVGGIGVSLSSTNAGQDGWAPFDLTSVEILSAGSAIGLDNSKVFGDVHLGVIGVPGNVFIATDSHVNGNLYVPESLQYTNFNESSIGKSFPPTATTLKEYGQILHTSFAGVTSILGPVGDGRIIDSAFDGSVIAGPGDFRIDRTTEYYINTHGTVITPGATVIIETGGGGGAVAFTDLTDVPASYIGQAGKYVRVNMAASGLEFVVGSIGGGAEGYIRIADVTVPGGVADLKTYQDPSNTVLQTCRVSDLSVLVSVVASYPKVTIGATTYYLTLSPDGGHYSGALATTLPGAGTLTVNMTTPEELPGAFDSIVVSYTPPPTILTLSFTGGYPGAQTELKAGDFFQITGTTDVAADGIEIVDFGAGSACVGATIAFPSNTTFTVTGTIADRGTVVQSLPARLRAKRAVTGAYGPTRDTNTGGGSVDGTDLVKCNNLYPTVAWGAVTYPGVQGALKNIESALVVWSASNYNTVAYTSPNGDLSITLPGTPGSPKTVNRIAGTYNVSTNNLRSAATRTANAATTTVDTLVKIAHVAASVSVTNPAARLRSGGSDGTAAQNHLITIVSDQELLTAPTMLAGVGGGVLQGVAWVGGPSNWTRYLQVLDSYTKGTYTWNTLSATNLAGIVTSAITGSANYVLGGFVQRSLIFPAYLQTTTMNVAVVTYTKLQAGIFTATNQPANRNAVQGNHSDIVDTFTVDSIGTPTTNLWWNDVTAASTNSSGTAQITNVEEVV